MNDDQLLIMILLIHFLGDFALQSDKQAKNKYKVSKDLFSHVFTYSFCWFFASYLYYGNFSTALGFASITFVCHAITDAITSNISKEFFDNEDTHNGFVVIGVDQMLHYIQLYFTFKLLS